MGNQDVFVKKFDDNMNAVSGSIVVNSAREFTQYQPSISVLQNGDWIVAWWDESDRGIHIKKYSASGVAIEYEDKIKPIGLGGVSQPMVVKDFRVEDTQ